MHTFERFSRDLRQAHADMKAAFLKTFPGMTISGRTVLTPYGAQIVFDVPCEDTIHPDLPDLTVAENRPSLEENRVGDGYIYHLKTGDMIHFLYKGKNDSESHRRIGHVVRYHDENHLIMVQDYTKGELRWFDMKKVVDLHTLDEVN
jgi:hypothetical protein